MNSYPILSDMNTTTIPARTNGMRISTHRKGSPAVYLYAFVPLNYHRTPADQLRCSIGIDPNIGCCRPCQVFGRFGRWQFRFNLPRIPWLFVARHQWAMPLYQFQQRILFKIAGK